MDARIFNILERVQGTEDEDARNTLMGETNEELAAHFGRNTNDLEELAFDLFNEAWADAQEGDLVSTLIETKTVGLGDTDWMEEDLRGMRAYFQGKGGQIRSDIIRYERQFMPREELVTAIDMHQDEMLLDFWGMLGKLQSQAQEKMRSAPAQRLVELFQASINGGVTYGQFAATTFSGTDIDPILEAVALRSGGKATIFGTRPAIRKLANIGLQFGQNIQEIIFNSGTIGTYKGYPVTQLDNWEDFDGKYVLPNDELFIIGRNAGRLTWYGAQAKVQQLKLPSFYMRWETARDVGLSLYGVGKGRAGRIKFT